MGSSGMLHNNGMVDSGTLCSICKASYDKLDNICKEVGDKLDSIYMGNFYI